MSRDLSEEPILLQNVQHANTLRCAKFSFIVFFKILKMRKFIDLASVERKFYHVIKR